MTKFVTHLKHNVVAYLALFVALGGTSYAAINIRAGSVDTRALKNHSITPIKFARNGIAGYVRDWATIGPTGNIVASRPRAHLVYWHEAQGTSNPGGLVAWDDHASQSCFQIATASSPIGAYASTSPAGNGQKSTPVALYVSLSAPDTAVSVAVICPQP